MMTFKEMNLAVFRGEPVPHVFFQPRFEPWFDWHLQFGSLPPELRGLSLLDAYDLVGASMRTVHYYTGQPDPVEMSFTGEVNISEQCEPERIRRRYDTPFGPLFEEVKLTVDRAWRLRWLLARRVIRFSPEKFARGAAYIGDRGEPQFWVPKSPYLALAQQWMRLEDFIYALADNREQVEDIMTVIDESYDELYEQLMSDGALHILNFGENIEMAYVSTDYFERYLIPWYARRSGQLRNAGIFTHVHIDGYFKPLLPYLADLPFDGLEALTAEPQGDVTLEEIRDHIGNKVLLDGIPAVLFLDHYSREELQRCVETVVSMFHPRLVLGISDELPEGGGEETFNRLKWVAQWCREQHSAAEPDTVQE
jgi:hypothetical protein